LIDLDRANADRIKTANLDIAKSTIQDASDAAQQILSDDKQSANDRLTAAVAFIQHRKI